MLYFFGGGVKAKIPKIIHRFIHRVNNRLSTAKKHDFKAEAHFLLFCQVLFLVFCENLNYVLYDFKSE
jgi:hypothetical protein